MADNPSPVAAPPQGWRKHLGQGGAIRNLYDDNKGAFAKTLTAFAGAELTDRLPMPTAMKHLSNAGASALMLKDLNYTGIRESIAEKEIADVLMHGLNTGMAGYGILANDKEAIQTSALMTLLFKLSHEAQENAASRYAGIRKEFAMMVPGAPLLIHEAHEEGHHHDHGPLYETDDAENVHRLNEQEQEAVSIIFSHRLEDIKAGFAAFAAFEQADDETREAKWKSFNDKYAFLRLDHDPHADHDHAGHDHKDQDHDHDHAPAEAPILIAENYDAFRERFSDMIYQGQKNGRGKWIDMHAREIEAGDRVRVVSGQRIPADGKVALVNGKHTASVFVDTSAYSGDSKKETYSTSPIFQTAQVLKNPNGKVDTVEIEVDTGYWESTGNAMLGSFTVDKQAKHEMWLKNFIDTYVKGMMVFGGALFFKDAIKKSPEGTYLDLEKLKTKKNLKSTFEFFVSAAPCPLNASMLLYKTVEEMLKNEHIFVNDRSQLARAKDTDVVIFDITGTLTKGEPKIDEEAVKTSHGANLDELKTVAFLLEENQKHPVAETVRDYSRTAAFAALDGHQIQLDQPAARLSFDGQEMHSGLSSRIDGQDVHIGNLHHFEELKAYYDAQIADPEHPRTHNPIDAGQLAAMRESVDAFCAINPDDLRDAVIVWKEHKDGRGGDWAMLGHVDEMRTNSRDTIEEFIKAGKEVVIATGTSENRAKAICDHLGISGRVKLHADLSPGSAQIGEHDPKTMRDIVDLSVKNTKTDIIRSYKKDKKVVMMIGDGVNDAQAIKLADVGIGIQSPKTSIIQRSAGIMVRDIDEPLRLMRLSKQVDDQVKKNAGFSGIWMAFLTALHFAGKKTKEWFNFEVGSLAKGVLHEGFTLYITGKSISDSNHIIHDYQDQLKQFTSHKVDQLAGQVLDQGKGAALSA